MKSRFLITLLTGLLFISCNTKSVTENILKAPETPENISFDIDNDGVPDFEINYSFSIIFSINSEEGILGRFTLLGDNQVLSKENEPYLYLENTNAIKENVENPYKWVGLDGYIVEIENHFENGWPSSWTIASEEIKDSYIIGLKLLNSSTTKFGWVEIRIDESTGIVDVVDSGIL